VMRAAKNHQLRDRGPCSDLALRRDQTGPAATNMACSNRAAADDMCACKMIMSGKAVAKPHNLQKRGTWVHRVTVSDIA
jgi:hypothetical protein